MRKGQYQESQIINKIKSDLSRDSSQRAKLNAAAEYSNWFYVERSHDLSLHNQKLCAQKTIDIVGIDVNTAVGIQADVIRAYTIAEGMLTARETIQQHHLTASSLINQQLTDQAQKLSIKALQEQIDQRFVNAYDNSNGILDISGFYEAGNRAVARTVEHLRYQAGQRDAQNGTGHKVLEHKHSLNFSFNLMSDQQAQNLAEFLSWQELNLAELNLSSNNITCRGVEPLFWGLRVSPDHLPHAHIRSHNLQFINLSNCKIGDPGASYIAESLKSGRYPHLRKLDVHGNDIGLSGNKYFIQAAKNIHQPIKIVVDTIGNGLKKQGTPFAGSKEERQAVVEGILEQSQVNGVDVQNVTVSKDIWTTLDNAGYLVSDFAIGWTRCSIVPEGVKSFAADQIIATASKKAGVVKTAVNVVTCYFETFDESASSQEGVQFMRDIGLVGTGEFIDSVE